MFTRVPSYIKIILRSKTKSVPKRLFRSFETRHSFVNILPDPLRSFENSCSLLRNMGITCPCVVLHQLNCSTCNLLLYSVLCLPLDAAKMENISDTVVAELVNFFLNMQRIEMGAERGGMSESKVMSNVQLLTHMYSLCIICSFIYHIGPRALIFQCPRTSWLFQDPWKFQAGLPAFYVLVYRKYTIHQFN